MNRTVLSKEVSVDGDKIVILENIETRLNVDSLQVKLMDIQRRKDNIVNHNQRLIAEYRDLEKEEKEVKSQLLQLGENGELEEL